MSGSTPPLLNNNLYEWSMETDLKYKENFADGRNSRESVRRRNENESMNKNKKNVENIDSEKKINVNENKCLRNKNIINGTFREKYDKLHLQCPSLLGSNPGFLELFPLLRRCIFFAEFYELIVYIQSRLPVLQQLDPNDSRIYISAENGALLFKSSLLILFPLCFAFYLNLKDFGYVTLIVFCTSINHWRKPRLGIRRVTDVAAVLSAYIYHVIAAIWRSPLLFLILWLFFTTIAICCYLYGRNKSSTGNAYIGTLCHIALHALSCISNIILYYGIFIQTTQY